MFKPTYPEKEKFLKMVLTFLDFFGIYYYVRSNDDILWQAEKGLTFDRRQWVSGGMYIRTVLISF